MPISTVIFDLDGLLADTERLHLKSYKNVFSRLGAELSDDVYVEHWIRLGKGIGDYIEETGLNLDLNRIKELKKNEYNRLVAEEAQPMPGALELLEQLRGKKTLTLATSSYSHSAHAVMAALKINDFFSYVAFKECVKDVKPAPDIFLHVAETLDVKPCECVVFEDSEKGILAAAAAGVPCIAVPNEFTRKNDFSAASMILSSLTEVNLTMIDEMSPEKAR